jgi:hypothetical protein
MYLNKYLVSFVLNDKKFETIESATNCSELEQKIKQEHSKDAFIFSIKCFQSITFEISTPPDSGQ